MFRYVFLLRQTGLFPAFFLLLLSIALLSIAALTLAHNALTCLAIIVIFGCVNLRLYFRHMENKYAIMRSLSVNIRIPIYKQRANRHEGVWMRLWAHCLLSDLDGDGNMTLLGVFVLMTSVWFLTLCAVSLWLGQWLLASAWLAYYLALMLYIQRSYQNTLASHQFQRRLFHQ